MRSGFLVILSLAGAVLAAACNAIVGLASPSDTADAAAPLPDARVVTPMPDAGTADATLDADAGCAATGCAPGTQRCAPGNVVQTCSALCTWSISWPCTLGCGEGGCIGGSMGLSNPSCVTSGSATDCDENESCCGAEDVPGGEYYRTYTSDADGGAEGEADPATVSGFGLDVYDVTVGRFRQYVTWVTGDAGAPPAAGAGKHVHLNGGSGLAVAGMPGTYESGWDQGDWDTYIATGAAAVSTWSTNLACDTAYDTWTDAPASHEALPINCVNWFEAYAFCIWDGGFLPSEAEWEYAAAGGAQQREYPWGGAQPTTDNALAIYECNYPQPTDAGCSGSANIAPVGTAEMGQARWGQLDMAGDLFQWTLDWFAAPADPCQDCAAVTSTGQTVDRSTRGGSFGTPPMFLAASYRYKYPPTTRRNVIGFRCARTPF